MSKRLYSITEFANKASVSTRTLRFYHKRELLIPSHINKLGYRLYSDDDLIKLQYILALKFIGFSLEEIRLFIQDRTIELQDVLHKQKMMMEEKKAQIGTIIGAIEEVEKLIQKSQCDYNSITKVIQAVQKGQRLDWINKYLTPEQSEYMRNLAKRSYSKETLKKLCEKGWSEEEHKKHIERYTNFRRQLKLLVEKDADPASLESQKLGQMLYDMNNNFSKGDPEVIQGMKNSWDYINSAFDDKKPSIYKMIDKEREFIRQVMIVFYRGRKLKK